jgi:3-polyprenyl-4-hydroxybenzoate decarboxylase
MCDLFGSHDNSAQQAALQQQQATQAQEDKRHAAIASGKQNIDSAFSQFDQPYFDNYTKTYTTAQNGGLADQYGIAKDKLVAALAGRDTLESTGGANAISQLDKTNQDAQAQIGSNAVDATNQLKSTVNNAKTGLYNQNINAADPLAAASEAQATAGTIVAPQSVPTLSGVFASALQPLATAQKVNNGSLFPSQNFNAPLSGSGSGVFG